MSMQTLKHLDYKSCTISYDIHEDKGVFTAKAWVAQFKSNLTSVPLTLKQMTKTKEEAEKEIVTEAKTWIDFNVEI